ncbi:hypothetical protein, partial [uncultured Algibacter sp.]|uniref:hypothetical protein n=1 Tax=uncultured Algibacter sp. TaxID=298659 RepID=UPI003216C4BA
NANVVVTDGELNIELSDNGGSDRNWVWTRLTLERVGDTPQASIAITDGTYIISARHSGKNIEVSSSSTAN